MKHNKKHGPLSQDKKILPLCSHGSGSYEKEGFYDSIWRSYTRKLLESAYHVPGTASNALHITEGSDFPEPGWLEAKRRKEKDQVRENNPGNPVTDVDILRIR